MPKRYAEPSQAKSTPAVPHAKRSEKGDRAAEKKGEPFPVQRSEGASKPSALFGEPRLASPSLWSGMKTGAGKSFSSQIQGAAKHGTSGAGAALPYLDTIQRSFGRHDLAGVVAHTDSAAATGAKALGAEAFTTGKNVAFASPPSLFTAAHEAAHTVQQQAGVQLLGGVGQVADRYEQNADAVAARVVAGQSSEALLQSFIGATPAKPAGTAGHGVQLKLKNELSEVLLPTQANALAQQFKSSAYYVGIQRQRGCKSEDVDAAIATLMSSDWFTATVRKDESLAYGDDALRTIESAVLNVMFHGAVTTSLRTIRESDPARAVAGDAPISPTLLAELDLIAQEPQSVVANLHKGRSIFPKNHPTEPNSSVSMVHKTEFEISNKVKPRYLRFVKASKLQSGEMNVTVPGYVSYSKGTKADAKLLQSARRGDDKARKELVDTVRGNMATADWSFDGPAKEFDKIEKDKLTNIDTPGIHMSMPSTFPLILKTEFIGVLFEPYDGRVLNVQKYDDELIEFGENYPKPEAKPVNGKPRKDNFI